MGAKLTDANRLSKVRPDITEDWHPTLNGKLTPDDVSYGSKIVAWWVCKDNPQHVWDMTINARNRCGCPFCAGKRVDDTNSLEKLRPDIAAEWHPTKNESLSPSDVTAHSKLKVWWKCSINPNHEFESVVDSRTRRVDPVRCPHCTKWSKTSFPEQCIYYYLKRVFFDVINRHVIEIDGIKVEFDLFIPSLDVAIEYDGYLYHRNNDALTRDENKNRLSSKAGITLIRVRNHDSQQHRLPTLTGAILFDHFNRGTKKSESLKLVLCSIAEFISRKFILDESSYNALLLFKAIDIDADRTDIYQFLKDAIKHNSLRTKSPKLVLEWDHENNGGLTPDCIDYASNIKINWVCSKNKEHKWSATPSDRNVNKSGCPYCWEERRGETLKRQVLITFPDGSQKTLFGTKEASILTGVPMPTIWNAARDARKTRTGVKFEYIS